MDKLNNFMARGVQMSERGAGCLAIVFLCVMVGLFGHFACSSSNPPPASPPPTAPSTFKVQYRITGRPDSAIETNIDAVITMTIPGGGIEQHEFHLPHTTSALAFNKGEQVYISAQNKLDNGFVTVEILLDGVQAKTASSSGGYCIATVNWLAGQ